MARDWSYVAVDQIIDEIEALVPLYSGVGALKLDMPATRGRAAFESFNHEGTRYAFHGSADLQWPVASETGVVPAPTWLGSNAVTPTAGPGQLLLAPVPRLFDLGLLISKADILRHRLPGPTVLINPVDAERMGWLGGETVNVRTAYGDADFRLRLSADAPAGVALIPENMGVSVRGQLLDLSGAPLPATLSRALEMAIGD